MRRVLYLLIAALLLSLDLSAQNLLVGTWETARTEIDGDSFVSTLIFNEDGTFIRDHFMVIEESGEKISKPIYHDEGRWKLLFKGKKVWMKVKPFSIRVDAGKGLAGGIGKTVELFSKVDAIGSSVVQTIESLAENELVLIEVLKDEDDDTYSEVVNYIRK